jgi:hypothetical protein
MPTGLQVGTSDRTALPVLRICGKSFSNDSQPITSDMTTGNLPNRHSTSKAAVMQVRTSQPAAIGSTLYLLSMKTILELQLSFSRSK